MTLQIGLKKIVVTEKGSRLSQHFKVKLLLQLGQNR